MRICRGGSYRSAPFKWFLGAEETRTGPFLPAFPSLFARMHAMMDRPRVERVTNGRLPRQVVPLKNPRDVLGRGGIHTMASKVQETAANQRSSLLGSSANYVVWIQGKGVKSRSTSFFPCLSQYPWKFARRRKKKNFISFLFVRLSKSMRWSFW